jgi:hypothetical protein
MKKKILSTAILFSLVCFGSLTATAAEFRCPKASEIKLSSPGSSKAEATVNGVKFDVGVGELVKGEIAPSSELIYMRVFPGIDEKSSSARKFYMDCHYKASNGNTMVATPVGQNLTTAKNCKVKGKEMVQGHSGQYVSSYRCTSPEDCTITCE